MGIQDRDYMKRRPADENPDDGDANYSTEEVDERNARLLKRMGLVFGVVILVAVLVTIIALVLDK